MAKYALLFWSGFGWFHQILAPVWPHSHLGNVLKAKSHQQPNLLEGQEGNNYC
jgi:hypothetical protein